MSQPTVFRNSSEQDLLIELRLFIKGASSTTAAKGTQQLELIKHAVTVLKNLPSARDAVLEYFNSVLHSVSDNYITRFENETSSGKIPPESEYDEAAITEIQSVLSQFITDNAIAWVPIISPWSLELLGNISSNFSGRAHVSTGLNESLQLWMNCRATRSLIDITTQCLSSLITLDTETCINSLLDTSVKHSPNFDWVVAHVGSCFPNTVITRVLSCGLKDFCQNKSYDQCRKSPKLKSVVGILGHLAGNHCKDIHNALISLFKWSLEPTLNTNADSTKEQKNATVPYLLQLANMSPTILTAVCSDLRKSISLEVIIKLNALTDDWLKYFGSTDAIQDLIVSLILSCEKGGASIITILLECSFYESDDTIPESIRNNAREILECILQELDSSVRLQTNHNSSTLPLMKSLISELPEIERLLVSVNTIISQSAARIIIFIGHINPSMLIESITYLLKNGTSNNHFALIIRIIGDGLIDKTVQPYLSKDGHLSVVVEQCIGMYKPPEKIKGEDYKDTQIWVALLTLLRWECSNRSFQMQSKPVTRAILFNLVRLTEIFASKNISSGDYHVLSEIFELIYLDKSRIACTKFQAILNLINGFIDYFFESCNENGEIPRNKAYKRICLILQLLCTESKLARNIAIRTFLEKSLFGEQSVLFGALVDDDRDNNNNQSILKQNKKISKTIQLTKHSSVYNGGIIGTGKRKSVCVSSPPRDTVAYNTEQLVRVVRACCTPPTVPETSDNGSAVGLGKNNNNSTVLQDSVTWVSLLLVQFVSPDVMYNGLPWPEEEFSKVTIERDLSIRRLFSSIPLLWELLSLVALYRPALCYCSVLLRALVATLMHQWNSMGDQSKASSTDSYKSQMDATIRVLDVMALGQLLPPPLSNVRDVVPYLCSNELVAILRDCIWCYMRDHIPSPALFGWDANGLHWRDPTIARPPDIYTNTLRIIMQRNVKTVGHLYAQMFITLPSND